MTAAAIRGYAATAYNAIPSNDYLRNQCTAATERFSNLWAWAAAVPMQEVPSQLGLPKIPIPKQSELNILDRDGCVKTLNIMNTSRQGILSSLQAILANSLNKKLINCKSEIKNAVKQTADLSKLTNYCLAEYTWLPAGADAGVAGKYAKARTKGAELDLLEAEIIDDIKNKIPGYARTVAPVNAVIETSKDKIMAYAKKHPFTALLASAPLGLYTLLGYSAAFSIAAPPIVGAACVLGKWDQAVNAFKDSALVAKSVLSDAAATALPIGVLFATASVCNGNTDHVREIIGTGVAIHTVSLLYNNRSNIQKNALTFAQSAANRVLNTTKAWFKEGWTRGPLLATGGLAAVASSYVYGQELYSKFALGAGMIAIALQLTASALINLSEAKV